MFFCFHSFSPLIYLAAVYPPTYNPFIPSFLSGRFHSRIRLTRQPIRTAPSGTFCSRYHGGIRLRAARPHPASREEKKKGLLEQSRGSLSIPKLQRSRILPSGGRLQSLCTTVSSDEHVQDYLIRPPCPYPSAIWTPFLSDPFPSKYVDLYLERYVPRLSVEPDRKKRPQIRD